MDFHSCLNQSQPIFFKSRSINASSIPIKIQKNSDPFAERIASNFRFVQPSLPLFLTTIVHSFVHSTEFILITGILSTGQRYHTKGGTSHTSGWIDRKIHCTGSHSLVHSKPSRHHTEIHQKGKGYGKLSGQSGPINSSSNIQTYL